MDGRGSGALFVRLRSSPVGRTIPQIRAQEADITRYGDRSIFAVLRENDRME